MEVKFTKLFEKDLKSIAEKQIILRVDEIIIHLRSGKHLQELSGIKKVERPKRLLPDKNWFLSFRYQSRKRYGMVGQIDDEKRYL
jgi:hypothetical protein